MNGFVLFRKIKFDVFFQTLQIYGLHTKYKLESGHNQRNMFTENKISFLVWRYV